MTNDKGNEAVSEESVDFIPLFDLLKYPRTVSVASIATAIESKGIWAWDEFGRLMSHDNKSTKSTEALKLLTRVRSEDLMEQLPHEQRSDTMPLIFNDDPFDGPLLKFGWLREKLPNFESIRAGQMELVVKRSSQRERASDLRIIRALVEYIRSIRLNMTEAELIRQLVESYPNNEGVSKTSLENRFAEAKREDFQKPKAQEVTPTNK